MQINYFSKLFFVVCVAVAPYYISAEPYNEYVPDDAELDALYAEQTEKLPPALATTPKKTKTPKTKSPAKPKQQKKAKKSPKESQEAVDAEITKLVNKLTPQEQEQFYKDVDELVKGEIVVPAPAVDMVKQKMCDVYKDVSGFDAICAEDLDAIKLAGGEPTYGEITYEGLQHLIDDIQFKQIDSFYDFGSGVGKVAMQVYLKSPVGLAVGVELSKDRHERAQKARIRIKELDLIDPSRTLKYLNGDMLEAKVAPVKKGGRQVVFTCSTCFSHDLMHKLMEKLAKEFSKGSILLSLKSLPDDYKEYGFEEEKVYHEPMTWMPTGSAIHKYVLTSKSRVVSKPKSPKQKKATCGTHEVKNEYGELVEMPDVMPVS